MFEDKTSVEDAKVISVNIFLYAMAVVVFAFQ